MKKIKDMRQNYGKIVDSFIDEFLSFFIYLFFFFGYA